MHHVFVIVPSSFSVVKLKWLMHFYFFLSVYEAVLLIA